MVTAESVLAIVDAWRSGRRGFDFTVLPAEEIARQLGGLPPDPPPSVRAFVELLIMQVTGELYQLAMAGEVSVTVDGLAVVG